MLLIKILKKYQYTRINRSRRDIKDAHDFNNDHIISSTFNLLFENNNIKINNNNDNNENRSIGTKHKLHP
jgi:hypothetical protein